MTAFSVIPTALGVGLASVLVSVFPCQANPRGTRLGQHLGTGCRIHFDTRTPSRTTRQCRQL